jgi:hypothetical protein|tara:strand:- start:493 stop:678 length:186 start_codon:yes stop_codon:yes gene_type:complete
VGYAWNWFSAQNDLDKADNVLEQILEALRSERKTSKKSKVMLLAMQFLHLFGRCWYPHSSL